MTVIDLIVWSTAVVVSSGAVLLALLAQRRARRGQEANRYLLRRNELLRAAVDEANRYSLHFRDWEQDQRIDRDTKPSGGES